RRIIMHVGPTNSGKTYNAMQRLQKAESGVYCGPLRLLAHEVYERFNAKGIPCNLITGEDRRVREDVPASLTSCTVEMVPLTDMIDVAVIDEIQMISDPQRGWAWTQALLGLKAREVHLCGEPTAINLVKKICESIDEDVEINEYVRLSPLELADKSLNNKLENIRKGDCVVTFSRSNIFGLKREIESNTPHRCAVVYGGLPPETRAEQARLFNDPDSGFDVMVASDAVGMGLNLNIRRVIFESMEKFNGKDVIPLNISQVKQIAGRAGRFQTAYATGVATTLAKQDLEKMKVAMATPQQDLKMAGLQPSVDLLELFAHQIPGVPFHKLLEHFEDMAKISGLYFLCNFKDHKASDAANTIKIAQTIESLDLSLHDRYIFCKAPASVRDEIVVDRLFRFARDLSQHSVSRIKKYIDLPDKEPGSMAQLQPLESQHRVILLYIWLR
ncbi:P-loop containing nucleoside triphosphate hydrolase protein, partial [Thamnocephalis sphaerospora]